MSDEIDKISFGITKETKSSNNTPILVAKQVENNPMFPNGWEFPIARLVNVVFNPEFEKKDKTLVPVLDFIFKDNDGRQHIHREWEIELIDTSFQTKLDGLKVRIKHLYTTIFNKFPSNGIGEDASSFADFFKKIADAFNSVVVKEGEGEDVKNVKYYSKVYLYIKLTYYKTNLGFPLSPNFVERVIKDKPCKMLTINTTYDNLKPAKSNMGNGIPGVAGGTAMDTGELPDFDEDFN